MLFEWLGLPCVLEAKYHAPGATAQVAGQIEKRLTAGFGTLGIAVIYPDELRTAKPSPRDALAPAPLSVQLSAIGRNPGPWHAVTGVDGLVNVLDAARGYLIDDDALAHSVHLLKEAVTALTRGFATQPGHLTQLAQVVTASEATAGVDATDKERTDAERIGALAVITALMLQFTLCDRDPHVQAPLETSPISSGNRCFVSGKRTAPLTIGRSLTSPNKSWCSSGTAMPP